MPFAILGIYYVDFPAQVLVEDFFLANCVPRGKSFQNNGSAAFDQSILELEPPLFSVHLGKKVIKNGKPQSV